MSSEDKDVVAIAMRHHEDAAWFGSGLHDPNGYIFMAHKDRGELLAKLRMLRTGEAAPKSAYSDIVLEVAAPNVDVIWGNGYVYTPQHAERRSKENAALRFMLDNLHQGHWEQVNAPPRPWWRRALDRIAA